MAGGCEECLLLCSGGGGFHLGGFVVVVVVGVILVGVDPFGIGGWFIECGHHGGYFGFTACSSC